MFGCGLNISFGCIACPVVLDIDPRLWPYEDMPRARLSQMNLIINDFEALCETILSDDGVIWDLGEQSLTPCCPKQICCFTIFLENFLGAFTQQFLFMFGAWITIGSRLWPQTKLLTNQFKAPWAFPLTVFEVYVGGSGLKISWRCHCMSCNRSCCAPAVAIRGSLRCEDGRCPPVGLSQSKLLTCYFQQLSWALLPDYRFQNISIFVEGLKSKLLGGALHLLWSVMLGLGCEHMRFWH